MQYGTLLQEIKVDMVWLNMIFLKIKPFIWNEKDYYAGEPIFIANPRGKNEDDGVIITMINTINLETYLLILDAITMQEIARAQLPQQIPRGLHGKFFK